MTLSKKISKKIVLVLFAAMLISGAKSAVIRGAI